MEAETKANKEDTDQITKEPKQGQRTDKEAGIITKETVKKDPINLKDHQEAAQDLTKKIPTKKTK